MNNHSLIIVLLTISWLPIKGFMQPLVHVLPIVVLLVGYIRGSVYVSKKAFLFAFYITSFFIIIGLIRGHPFAYYNVVLSWLLLFPFYMLFFRFRNIREKDFLIFIKAVAWVSIIEFGVGIIQLIQFQGFTLVFADNAWDKVIGTTLSQSSHVYSLKMLFQGLVLSFTYKEIKKKYHSNLNLVKIGIVCAFLGSLISSYIIGVVMSIVFLAIFYIFRISKLLLSVIYSMSIKIGRTKIMVYRMLSIAIICSLGIFIFSKSQPGNYRLIIYSASMAMSGDFSDPYKFQKFDAFQQTFDKVITKDITTFIFGVGPGQYSSRAALFLTGDYLNPHPSYIPISMSEETREIIHPLWNNEQIARFRGSVMAMPSGSLISLFTEYGIIGLLIFLYLIKKMYKNNNIQNRNGLVGNFSYFLPVYVTVFLSQLILDLWLEFGSFTVFINLLFMMCISVKKK